MGTHCARDPLERLSAAGVAAKQPPRSSQLVEGRLAHDLGAAVVLVAGPLVGSLLLVLTNAPLVLLDVVAGIIYAVTMPFVALTTAYVYFDMRVRDELAAEGGPDRLPPEIGLGGAFATGRPAP